MGCLIEHLPACHGQCRILYTFIECIQFLFNFLRISNQLPLCQNTEEKFESFRDDLHNCSPDSVLAYERDLVNINQGFLDAQESHEAKCKLRYLRI